MRIQTSSSENKWKGKNIKKIIIHLFEGTFKNLQGSSFSKASGNVTIINEATKIIFGLVVKTRVSF